MISTILISEIIQALIYYYYNYNNNYNDKNRIKELTKLVMIIGMHIVLSLVYIINFHILLFGLLLVAGYFLLNYILYNMNLSKNITNTLYFLMLTIITELITYMVISIFKPDFIYNNNSEIISFLLMIISKGLLFISIIISSKNNTEYDNNQNSLLGICNILILISSVIIFISYVIIETFFGLLSKCPTLFLISGLLMAVINVLVVIMNNNFERKIIEYYFEKMQLQKECQELECMKLEKEAYENLRVLKHDMNNHISVMKELLYEGDIKELIKLVDGIENEVKTSLLVKYCNNQCLNILLNDYKEKFLNRDIEYNFDIRDSSLEEFDDKDVIAIFGNLLSNAYEATKDMQGYSFVDIKVIFNEMIGKNIISVKNSCEITPIFGKDGMPKTTKNSINHGLGIKSIKKAVKKYDGEIEFKSESGNFYVIIII